MTNLMHSHRLADRRNCATALIIGFLLCLSAAGSAAPTLTPGIWTNITPAELAGQSTPYTIEIDPTNPDVLYLPLSFMTVKKGLWKSTDRGSNWVQLGNQSTARTTDNLGDHVGFLDSPFRIEVDPGNPQRIYATDLGPGGSQTIGFWISQDGGNTWTMPKGLKDACITVGAPTDISGLSIDPVDFNHFLISFHYWWSNSVGSASGFMESKDGGTTWTIHYPNSGMDGGASRCITFLYNPALGIGDAKTWLMGCDGGPYWRTTDAGTTWTKVSPDGIWAPHGGNTYIYYAKNGVLYCDAVPYPMRSADNGATWVTLTNLPYAWYETSVGDGERLYASPNSGGFYTSPESDGKNWTRYAGTSPTVGAYMMRFDSVNRIMYATCKDAGVWALRLAGTTAAKGGSFYRVPATAAGNLLKIGKMDVTIRTVTGSYYDIKGKTCRAPRYWSRWSIQN